jgi:hypothetical protein
MVDNHRNKITAYQYSGIVKSINFGKIIKKEMPYLAIDFLNGSSLNKIIDNYELQIHYNLSKGTALNALRYALMGYNNSFLGHKESYDGLLDLITYNKAVSTYKTLRAYKRNIELKEKGKGFFDKQKMGEVREKHKLERKGIYAKKDNETLKKIVAKAVKSRNQKMWGKEEFYTALDLITAPNSPFLVQGKIKSKKIAETLNYLYHNNQPVRSSSAVSNIFYKFNKGKIKLMELDL